MPRKPKMPKYIGLITTAGGGLASARPGYQISVAVRPDEIGVSSEATNSEMVHAMFRTICRNERRLMADALRAASAPGAEPWALWIEGGGPIMRRPDGKGLPLADWIEQGMYRPEASAAVAAKEG
jgi:hypothetical protein